jgi:hypothetical protein
VSALGDLIAGFTASQVTQGKQNVGFPVPNLNTNETATSGSHGTGGGLGGTAFNIGGINFGTNNMSPANAQGGDPVSPISNLESSSFLVPVLIVAAGLAVFLLLRK